MSKTMYRATKFGIKAVEVDKETAAFVYFKNGRREAKSSGWQVWKDTWEKAHHAVLAQCKADVAKTKMDFDNAMAELEKVQEWTKEAGQ